MAYRLLLNCSFFSQSVLTAEQRAEQRAQQQKAAEARGREWNDRLNRNRQKVMDWRLFLKIYRSHANVILPSAPRQSTRRYNKAKLL